MRVRVSSHLLKKDGRAFPCLSWESPTYSFRHANGVRGYIIFVASASSISFIAGSLTNTFA